MLSLCESSLIHLRFSACSSLLFSRFRSRKLRRIAEPILASQNWLLNMWIEGLSRNCGTKVFTVILKLDNISLLVKQAVDALAMSAEEGRTKPRKSSGSCFEALIRRCPNGETPSCASRMNLRCARKFEARISKHETKSCKTLNLKNSKTQNKLKIKKVKKFCFFYFNLYTVLSFGILAFLSFYWLFRISNLGFRIFPRSVGGVPGELKYLSTQRKRNHRDLLSKRRAKRR